MTSFGKFHQHTKPILTQEMSRVSREVLAKEGRLVLRSIVCMLAEINNDDTILAIAANQMGINLPLFVTRIPLLLNCTAPTTDKWPKDMGLYQDAEAYLLPTYIGIGPRDLTAPESCLSYHKAKKVVKEVKRFSTILFTGYQVDYDSAMRSKDELSTLHTTPVHYTLTGLAAQVAQHEVDHLFGKGIWQHDAH